MMTYCNGNKKCVKDIVIEADRICNLKIYLNKIDVTIVN